MKHPVRKKYDALLSSPCCESFGVVHDGLFFNSLCVRFLMHIFSSWKEAWGIFGLSDENEGTMGEHGWRDLVRYPL